MKSMGDKSEFIDKQVDEKPEPSTQVILSNLVRDLLLSKANARILSSHLKKKNLFYVL